MCCFMEKMLANLLAEFEMKVEKEVLEPLNKLSEVKMCTWCICQTETTVTLLMSESAKQPV